jgi:hypothetical protein
MTGCAMIEEFDWIITGRGTASLDKYLVDRFHKTDQIGRDGSNPDADDPLATLNLL